MGKVALRLVRLQRKRFDPSPWYGFVAGESEQLIVFQLVSDRYDLDGYRCLRRSDLTLIEDDFPRRDLIDRALRLKGLQPGVSPIPVQETMREMMRAVQQKYQLVTIRREDIHPDECEIGQVRISSASSYVLRWLDPNAIWDPDDRPFKYADVTRLDFGGEYERTLLLVAADRERGA